MMSVLCECVTIVCVVLERCGEVLCWRIKLCFSPSFFRISFVPRLSERRLCCTDFSPDSCSVSVSRFFAACLHQSQAQFPAKTRNTSSSDKWTPDRGFSGILQSIYRIILANLAKVSNPSSRTGDRKRNPASFSDF